MKKETKLIISVLAAIGLNFLSLVFLIGTFFSAQKTALSSLLGIFYISIVVFLILWNVIISKKVYLILPIPVMCIMAVAVVLRYEESAYKITGNLPLLDGATALYPAYASFVQAVYPQDDYIFKELFCRGTREAYDKLLEGKADIIFCAGASNAQMERFNEHDKKIKFVPIGREAFVFFVNMGDIINEVAVYRNFPDAIGYSFLYYSTEMVKNDQIKLLSINGVHPSKDRICANKNIWRNAQK